MKLLTFLLLLTIVPGSLGTGFGVAVFPCADGDTCDDADDKTLLHSIVEGVIREHLDKRTLQQDNEGVDFTHAHRKLSLCDHIQCGCPSGWACGSYWCLWCCFLGSCRRNLQPGSVGRTRASVARLKAAIEADVRTRFHNITTSSCQGQRVSFKFEP